MAGGWRALIGTWIVLGLLLAGGVGWLAWLGPLPAAETAAPAASEAEATEVAAATQAGEPDPRTPAAETTAPEAPSGPTDVPPAASPRGTQAAAGLRPIPAPEPELLERGPHGPLPRIGPAGRSSIRAYGQPFDRQDPRPRIGLIVGGLGLNAALAEEAIRRLPVGVSLAFSPYAPQVDRLLGQARAKGMEVLLALPLEPTGYPLNTPGDKALLTGLSPPENEDRLLWALSRFAGYVGVIGAHGPMRGERYALLTDRLAELQQALNRRGLLYVDPRPGAPRPARAWGRVVDVLVDEPATRSEIELKLAQLERLARERGTALGYAGEPSPVLVERVAAWGSAVEGRGLVIAPISALIRAPSASVAEGRAATEATETRPAAPAPAPARSN